MRGGPSCSEAGATRSSARSDLQLCPTSQEALPRERVRPWVNCRHSRSLCAKPVVSLRAPTYHSPHTRSWSSLLEEAALSQSERSHGIPSSEWEPSCSLGHARLLVGALCHLFCFQGGLQRVEQMTGCVTAGVSCRAGEFVCHLIARLRRSRRMRGWIVPFDGKCPSVLAVKLPMDSRT